MTLKAARELADKARALIAKGIDPSEQKKVDKARRMARRTAEACTVRKLFEAWMAKTSGRRATIPA